MVDCKEIFELISDLLDEELEVEKEFEHEILEHIMDCPHCSPFLKTYKKTINLCHMLEHIEVPQEIHISFWQSIRTEIYKKKKKR